MSGCLLHTANIYSGIKAAQGCDWSSMKAILFRSKEYGRSAVLTQYSLMTWMDENQQRVHLHIVGLMEKTLSTNRPF